VVDNGDDSEGFGKPGFGRGRLMGSVVVYAQVDIEISRHGGVDSIEEAAGLGCAVAPIAVAVHLAGGNMRSSSQGHLGAMELVIMTGPFRRARAAVAAGSDM